MTERLIIQANDLPAERRRAFLAAFAGDQVIINHSKFPDGVFELTYRKRRAGFSEEPQIEVDL